MANVRVFSKADVMWQGKPYHRDKHGYVTIPEAAAIALQLAIPETIDNPNPVNIGGNPLDNEGDEEPVTPTPQQPPATTTKKKPPAK